MTFDQVLAQYGWVFPALTLVVFMGMVVNVATQWVARRLTAKYKTEKDG